MSKTRAQPDRARRPRRRVRRRRLPLPLPRRPALRSRRRLQLRGDGGALQRRSRQQLRQPRQPRAQHGGELLRRGGARHARRRSARRGRRDRVRRAHRDGSSELDFSGGFGAVWDLIRATNAYIEERQPWALHKAGDADAVAAVLGDCLEALRIVALLASPLIPRASRELWRRLGLPGTPEDQRLPEAAGVGWPPRRRAPREGRAAVPPDRHRVVTAGDSPSPLGRQPLPPGLGGSGGRPRHRGGAGPGGGGRGAGVRGHRPGVVAAGGRARRRGTPTCGRPSACTPTTPRRLDEEWDALVALARDRADVVVGDRRGRLRPPLRALAGRRAGGRVPRADRARARDSTARW